ncbi:MAG: RIO1 family regulatory kinase/ATPase [Polyangiaceae bacterium]
MASSLESLLAEGVITEIYGRLKSGKEADVYAVCYGDDVVAAKVYKDRAQRSFKSNATYKEGRSVRNTRSQRAMDRGSKFGQEAAEDAWKAAEATALYKLHGAGVRVPTPVLFLEGVLFMELVRGHDGEPAPRLIDTELSPEEARAAYLDMLAQLVRILSCDLIHGDLSPYNVLWAAGGATLIDFPQIVAAAQNSNSESFFMRDARNILGHFAEIDRSLQARLNGDTREIWRAYVRRELTPDFMPTGRPPPPEPRRVFDQERRPQQARDQRPQQPQSRDQRPQQQRSAQANHDGRDRQPSNQGSGTRPATGGAPRLQMASARANIASQSGAPERSNDVGRPQSNDVGRSQGDGGGRSQGNGGGRSQGNGGGRPQSHDVGRSQSHDVGRSQSDGGGRSQGNGGGRSQGNGGGRPQGNGGGRSQGNGGGRPQGNGGGQGNGADRNAGRRPVRGPEVIVLTRRAPEGIPNAVREPQPAATDRVDNDSPRRRR